MFQCRIQWMLECSRPSTKPSVNQNTNENRACASSASVCEELHSSQKSLKRLPAVVTQWQSTCLQSKTLEVVGPITAGCWAFLFFPSIFIRWWRNTDNFPSEKNRYLAVLLGVKQIMPKKSQETSASVIKITKASIVSYSCTCIMRKSLY